MAETYTENDIYIRLTAQIVEDNEKKNKPSNISGLSDVNPIVEALAAHLRRVLTDEQIARRFAKDEDSLRSVIVADSLMDRLNSTKRAQIIKLLDSGSSLEEITDRVAIEISDGKRTKDGKVLYTLSQVSGTTEKAAVKALLDSNHSNIYIESSEKDALNTRIKDYKNAHTRAYKTGFMTAGIIALASAAFGYYAYNNLEFSLKYKTNSNNQTTVIETVPEKTTTPLLKQ